MKAEVKRLIQNIIYILMGLQILLGAAWCVCNFGEVPGFEETAQLLTMSKTLRIDEYTGLLYPLLLRGALKLGAWSGLRYCVFLYPLQLLAAGAAYGYFLREVVFGKEEGSRRLTAKVVLGVGFLLTIPTMLQVHLAVLPYSLASSVFLMVLTDAVQLWRGEKGLSVKWLLRMVVLWVLSAQLCPDYGWFGGIALGITCIRYLLRYKERGLQLVAVLAAGVLCINGLNVMFQTEGCMGKIQKSPGAVMVARFVWPNFSNLQYFWGEEIKAIWDYDALVRLSTYPERVMYEFGPILEATYGKEEAERLYWEMTGQALKLDTKNILLRLAKDTGAYICPPLTMLLQLQGIGTSYTGWNYGRMKDYAPELTGYYVEYSLEALAFMAVLGVGNVLLYTFRKRRSDMGQEKQVKPRDWSGCYLASIFWFVNLWYVMCNGHMQDYKKLMVTGVLSVCLIIRLISTGHIDKESKKE